MRALLSLLPLALACTPPSAAVVDGGLDDEPLAAAAYCESVEPFFCAYYARCGRMTGASTALECRGLFLEQCEARYEPRYVALEQEGLIALDPDGLSACRAHLEQVACEEQIRDLDGPCAGMWLGRQPVGGSCGFDVESLVCAPEGACVLGLDLCGECRPLVAAGEACGAAAEGATCGADATCDDGVCDARVPVGEACGEGDRCVLGARCEGGRCVPPSYVAAGESCDATRRCRYGAHCEAGVCVADARLGAPCGGAVECATGWCGAGGVCKELLQEAEACEQSSQCVSAACLGGSCAPMPGRCFEG